MARTLRTPPNRRRAVAAALAWLAMAAALAGCSGGGDELVDAPGDGAATGAADLVAGIPKPEWSVGDAWTYTFEGTPTTYVVTSETATDWIMETDSAERSFADQREDISRLGPQRKSDLAGSQGDQRVEFFRWPLTDGATWSTTWDGVPVTVNALVDLGHAELTAADGEGNLVYRYTYDAESRWFTTLDRFAPDGTQEVALRLTGATHNWTGSIVHWDLQTVVADAGDDPSQPPPTVAGPFEVAAGTTDIWVEYHFTCTGNGGYSVVVEPVNPGLASQQGMYDGGPCVQVDWADPIVADPHPGTWTMLVSAGGQTITYDYAILLRTRTDVPFGGAGSP